jgi:hypothetical protein
MKNIRRYSKPIACFLALLQLLPTYLPWQSFALTGGPSVPEVQQFSSVENTELVNLFTGDFNYQIPLMDVGGYPLTLSYSSNIGMESEASMVGLGWNINTGSISRDVRGLPDDFSGDKIKVTKSAKPNETIVFGAGLDMELTGYELNQAAANGTERGGYRGSIGIGASLEMKHNSYKGWSAGFTGGVELKGSSKGNFKSNAGLGLSVSANSESGSTVNTAASIGFASKIDEDEAVKGGLNYGLGVNTRQGIKKNSFGADIGYKNTSTFGEDGGIKMNKIGIDKGEFSAGGKFDIGFSSPSMTPAIDWPMYTDGMAGQIKLGGEIGGVLTLTGNLEFSYQNERYAKNYDEVPAYGYMYAHNSNGGRELMDLIRGKDGSFSSEIPNLPMSQFAHDLFRVNVQGIQTTFRPFRGDAGTLHNPFANSVSCKGGVGADVAAGDLVKIGANIKVPVEYGQSGKWTDGNEFNNLLKFRKEQAGNPLYEPVYFKSMGEATAMANPQLFNAMGTFAPVRPTVNADGNTSNEVFIAPDKRVNNFSNVANGRQNREFRQNNFQWLTVQEAANFGFRTYIQSYPLNSFLQSGTGLATYESRILKIARGRTVRKLNHISEITITRADGRRFVFGIPAYNNFSADVTFNISGNKKDKKGMVHYTAGVDNSIANTRGKDRQYEKEETPGSAYAWLLTEMLSADYVDLTGNGPSPDDLGTYTKFNYTRTSEQYNWRVPVQKDSAIFKEGVKSDKYDDKASYSFGSKELWYLHSIETKNYIAEFTYSDRDDAVGVQGENGGLSTSPQQRMKKLDKIELYTKASRLEEGAVPIKSVHFVYDYSLCGKVPNNINGGGKLTLKHVWFQYGNSEKGSRNPYIFTYSNFNPDYHPKKFDRWGNYINAEATDDGLKTYASLPKNKADEFASAWLLTKIVTPTGSVLNIEYESNDYAFVQDLRAMEMVQVVGFKNYAERLNAADLSGEDPTALLYSENSVRNYVQFKLKQPVNSDEEVRTYVEGISELYFGMNVLLSNPIRDSVYEKIEGFIPVNLLRAGIDFGKCTNGNYGWLRLPQMHDGDEIRDMNTPANDMTFLNGVHPVSKAAWETIRKKFMKLVYNQSPDVSSPEALGVALENCFNTLGEMFTQANIYLRNGKHANTVKLKGAKIRLNSPDLIKFGGGARVKKISVSDEWGNMVQDPALNFSYGKQYSYRIEENVNGINRIISSGVAQYEPATGNEENPFVVPYRYAIEKPLSVDFNLYQTGPVGQIYFPAPVVGYRKVIVKDLQPEGAPATGYAVHEFYTAKDFPTVVKTTDLKFSPREIQVPPFYSEEHLNATQGFCIELNDMHGKQKSTMMFAPGATSPVSGAMYKYKTEPGYDNRLSNYATTVNPETGAITEELFGIDYEFFADARENQYHSMLPEVGVNLDISLRGPIPVIIPSVYPGYTHYFGRLRLQTFNKVIYRCGLLEETIAFDNGAQISTRLLLRDRESGEVVLQDVVNEFGDKQYNLTYPARWLVNYKGMNGAYRNAGVQLQRIRVSGGTATIPNASQYFQQGDEVVCIQRDAETPSAGGSSFGPTDVYTTAWVMNVDDNQYVRLIDRAGALFPNGTYDLRVVRSGYRNHINAPMAKFNLRASPVRDGRLSMPINNVLSAQTTEYSNHWQTYGLFESAPPVYRCTCSHAQINKRNAVDMLGELVNTLLTRGDYKRSGVNIAPTYSTGAAFFTPRFGNQAITYNGMLSGSVSRGVVTPYNSTEPSQQCELNIRMENGSTFFPDSILSFTINSRSFNDGDGDCDDIYTAIGTITYLGEPTPQSNLSAVGSVRPILTSRVTITTCIPLANCETAPNGRGEIRCLGTGRTVINPFVTGVLNNWRPLHEWVFATTLQNNGNLQTGGTYNDFQNFFTGSFPLRFAARSAGSKWVRKSSLILCDNHGRNIESKDAIDNYSAELYGYGFSLPIATASNARHNEIAFDGFEDYNFRNQPNNPFNTCRLPAHFKPIEYDALDKNISHTGLYSLPVASGTSVTRNFVPRWDRPVAATTSAQYHADNSVIISPFSPARGKEYHLSVWVKKEIAQPPSSSNAGFLQQISRDILPTGFSLPGVGSGIGGALSATNSDVVVTARNSAGTVSTIGRFAAEGNSVDGWYQVNGKFTVPPDMASITVELRAVNGKAWFDDLRIQPFNSVMKTFVYHPLTLRLMATLDENNYATFYVYDQQEQLVATKKETEDGIFTVQEARHGTSKISRP